MLPDDSRSVCMNADGNIRVAAESVALPGLMQQLAEVAGFECRGCSVLPSTQVSVDYVNTDLKTLLSELLTGTSFLLENTEIGQIGRVLILHEATPDHRRADAASDESVFAGLTRAERDGFDIAHQRLPPAPNEQDFRIRQTPAMRAYGPGGPRQRIKHRVVADDPRLAGDRGVYPGLE